MQSPRVSEAFRLGDDPLGLEFCAGLAATERGTVIISAGIGDNKAELIECSVPIDERG